MKNIIPIFLNDVLKLFFPYILHLCNKLIIKITLLNMVKKRILLN